MTCAVLSMLLLQNIWQKSLYVRLGGKVFGSLSHDVVYGLKPNTTISHAM